MKIVQINTVCGTGSVGRIALNLYHLTEENKNQSLFIYGRNNAPLSIHSYKTGTNTDLIGHVLLNFLSDKSGFGSVRQTKKLIEFLQQYKPDLIHLHNIHGFYLQIEILFEYIKKNHIPIVWTLHDCWAFTGHCAYYDSVNCNRYRDGCPKCPHHARLYPYALFKDDAAVNFKRKEHAFTEVENLTLVTPSKWLATQVKQSFLKAYPIQVIPNGIDLHTFSTRPQSENDGRIHILGVANIWERRKGLVYFLKLAECLPQNYHITLVGLNAKQKNYFTRRYSEDRVCAKLKTNCIEELAQCYRNADVYVNPTLEDNFPTTNLEALACGIPVVSFEVGGSCEMLDSSCGISVSRGDLQGLIEGIFAATQLKSEECRKKAMLYGKMERLKEYLELYQKLVYSTLR